MMLPVVTDIQQDFKLGHRFRDHHRDVEKNDKDTSNPAA